MVLMLRAILDQKHPKAQRSYADQIAFVADRPGHDARYAVDYTRVRTQLGWQPSIAFEEGIALTVDWYLNNRPVA